MHITFVFVLLVVQALASKKEFECERAYTKRAVEFMHHLKKGSSAETIQELVAKHSKKCPNHTAIKFAMMAEPLTTSWDRDLRKNSAIKLAKLVENEPRVRDSPEAGQHVGALKVLLRHYQDAVSRHNWYNPRLLNLLQSDSLLYGQLENRGLQPEGTNYKSAIEDLLCIIGPIFINMGDCEKQLRDADWQSLYSVGDIVLAFSSAGRLKYDVSQRNIDAVANRLNDVADKAKFEKMVARVKMFRDELFKSVLKAVAAGDTSSVDTVLTRVNITLKNRTSRYLPDNECNETTRQTTGWVKSKPRGG